MTGGLLRVLRDRRAAVLPLAVALVLNIAVFGLVVFPSFRVVAGAEQRERAALDELADAEREHAAASRVRQDKERAERNLRTFYEEVLPADLAGARRATYVHLAQLARDAGLRYQRRVEQPRPPATTGEDRSSTLARFDITMVLEGDYEGVRQFLREVEASDSFIVIDNVGLAEGSESSGDLVLTINMSTYYRAGSRER
ncbi:MAG TPA: GspMb/PilO family protein [Vicinamibacterales bacterium]|nr:GspMb/PilO family protein [Vicinamibacterales bacterium]HPW21404.1 GspMb/PilO family protein [Vicinamibacterales bacterium]